MLADLPDVSVFRVEYKKLDEKVKGIIASLNLK